MVVGVIKKDNPPVKMIDSGSRNFILQTLSLLLAPDIVGVPIMCNLQLLGEPQKSTGRKLFSTDPYPFHCV